MNKTIIININGIVFHIEEDAYEVLIQYMNEVKQHFGYSADSYEIVSDIENRLAEMFTEKLAEAGKEVIVLADVAEVTAQMGKPSDFDLGEEQETFEPTLGKRTERKLFRDTDDRIIGGVCAGIGHYFDVEPRWIRVILLLSLIFFGTGLFLYLILWVVMPKALTRADKMAMKGEKPNLQNFKKNFDEEMQAVKENLGSAKQEIQPFFQRLGRFIEQVFSHLSRFLGSTGKVILKIIGALLIFFGVMILFSMFVGLLAVLGIWNSGDLPIFPFNIVNPENRFALYISVFLVILIPLVSLILFAVRVVFNRPKLNRNVSFGLLILWLVSLTVGLYYGFKTGGEFKQEARFSQTSVIKPYPVYYLELNEEKFLTKEDSLNYSINNLNKGISIRSNHDNMSNSFNFSIEKADVDQPVLITEYQADGKSFQNALEYAKRIKYRFIQQDSSLKFDATIHIKQQELWRNQQVKLTLKVPVNTRLIINSELNRYINNHNLFDCLPEDSNEQLPSEWIMTNEGLTCKNDSLYKQNKLNRGH